MKKNILQKSSIGEMDANIVAVIAYLGGSIIGLIRGIGYGAFLVPLVIYVIEKRSLFVKKHAAQALGLYVTSTILLIIFSIVVSIIFAGSYNNPYMYGYGAFRGLAILSTFTMCLSIVISIFSIIAIIRAYYYKEYRIPFINSISSKIADVLDKVIKYKIEDDEDETDD